MCLVAFLLFSFRSGATNDDEVGVKINVHSVNLWGTATNAMSAALSLEPPRSKPRAETFELSKFQHGNETRPLGVRASKQWPRVAQDSSYKVGLLKVTCHAKTMSLVISELTFLTVPRKSAHCVPMTCLPQLAMTKDCRSPTEVRRRRWRQ